jgi:hypothetical protein
MSVSTEAPTPDLLPKQRKRAIKIANGGMIEINAQSDLREADRDHRIEARSIAYVAKDIAAARDRLVSRFAFPPYAHVENGRCPKANK